MPASCIPVFARVPVHSSAIVSEGQPTFRIDAPRHTSRLARGHAPLNPAKAKGRKGNETRQACPHCRCRRACIAGGARYSPLQRGTARYEHVGVHPPDLSWHPPSENAGRETATEGLARIGSSINQLARWANTYKRAAEAVEILTALAGIERRIAGFASCASTEDESEAEPC